MSTKAMKHALIASQDSLDWALDYDADAGSEMDEKATEESQLSFSTVAENELDGTEGTAGRTRLVPAVNPKNPKPHRESPIKQWSWVLTLDSGTGGSDGSHSYSYVKSEKIIECLRRYAEVWVFQMEQSETGHVHYQGICKMNDRRRKAPMIGLFSKFLECDPRQFQCRPAIDWLKLEFYVTKAEGRMAGPWSYGIKYIQPAPIFGIIPYDRMYPWQKYVWDICQYTPITHPKGTLWGSRVIHWFWSSDGNTGKTAMAKTIMHAFPNTLMASGKAKDIASRVIQGNTPDIVIMNISRGTKIDCVSYAALEFLKDGILSSGKYEGGQKLFNPPWVFVFANMDPMYDQLSHDRWEVRRVDDLHAEIPRDW